MEWNGITTLNGIKNSRSGASIEPFKRVDCRQKFGINFNMHNC